MDETHTAPIYILKLGGSVISHSNKLIDYDYLREFRDVLQEQIILGKKFILVIGGGQTSREFIEHAQNNGKVTDENDLHLIGTAANTLNAEMVKAFLGSDLTEDKIWKYAFPEEISQLPFTKPIVVAGGFAPGMSSDAVAFQIAKALGVKEVFDLKNQVGVYDKDPAKFSDATVIPDLTWADYTKLINNPEKHMPGANYPVDIVAARGAEIAGITFHILAGKDLHNLESAISDLPYQGTIIH